MAQYFFNFILDIKFQGIMDCEHDEYTAPKCPHLRPTNSSQDFDDITLEDDFSLSSEIETQTPESDIFREDFIEVDEEPVSKGKRSFHEARSTTKPSFQYYIERPQKRQMYVKMAGPRKKFTVEAKLAQLILVFTYIFFIISNPENSLQTLMRKKQANLYFPNKKHKEPPFLTKEELKDFQSQFNLFNREINLPKLRDSMLNQNYHQFSKPVFNFIQKVSQQNKTICFKDYLAKVTENITGLDQGELIAEMLDEQKKGEIRKQFVKEILEEVLGRQILGQQMNEIMLKLFDSNDEKVPTEMIKKLVNQKGGFFPE